MSAPASPHPKPPTEEPPHPNLSRPDDAQDATSRSGAGRIGFVALGSNRGDSAALLRRAVREMEAGGALVEARSSFYRTASVEGGGEGDFLNAVVRLRWSGEASELLDLLQAIEARAGRPAPPRSGPRTLDLDLLALGDEQSQDARLTLPHPRLATRPFVLVPLLEVLEDGAVQKLDLEW